jgi:hypothetical protein
MAACTRIWRLVMANNQVRFLLQGGSYVNATAVEEKFNTRPHVKRKFIGTRLMWA